MHILKIPPHPVVGATRILSESLSINTKSRYPTFWKKIRVLCNKKLPNEEKSDIETYQNAQICYEGGNMREDYVRRLSRNDENHVIKNLQKQDRLVRKT
ncbi:hypothetical protein YC2023_117607 [Brassica napus]